MLKPSGRGRKPNNVLAQQRAAMDYNALSASMSSYASLASAGLLGQYPKMAMGFGAMPGLYNPMYAASLAGFGMMPNMAKAVAAAAAAASSSGDEENKEKAEKDEVESKEESPKKKESPSKEGSSEAVVPHPSFPMMYNPMLFNPLFAQNLGNFTLPTGIPTSFASLAQHQLLNGVKDSDEGEQEAAKITKEAELMVQDLSMKASRAAQDVSVKKKHRDKEGHSKHRDHASIERHKDKEKRTTRPEQTEPMDFSKKKESKEYKEQPKKVGLESIVKNLKDKPKKGLADIVKNLSEKKDKPKEVLGVKAVSLQHKVHKDSRPSPLSGDSGVVAKVDNRSPKQEAKLAKVDSRSPKQEAKVAKADSILSKTEHTKVSPGKSQDQKDKCDDVVSKDKDSPKS